MSANYLVRLPDKNHHLTASGRIASKNESKKDEDDFFARYVDDMTDKESSSLEYIKNNPDKFWHEKPDGLGKDASRISDTAKVEHWILHKSQHSGLGHRIFQKPKNALMETSSFLAMKMVYQEDHLSKIDSSLRNMVFPRGDYVSFYI